MVAGFERCHIKNIAETEAKMKGVVKFLPLENLSTNLYDTFQKHTLYTRNILYYHTLKSKGVMGFTTPYDTFMTPFGRETGYFSALKYLGELFLRHLSTQKRLNWLYRLIHNVLSPLKGVVRCHIASLKGGISLYATFHIEQEVFYGSSKLFH